MAALRLTRRHWVWAHRWVGLLAGALLALLGFSGSLMVWQGELDAALNPRWFAARPACAAPAAADLPATPIARVLAVMAQQAPGQPVATVVAPQQPGAAYQLWAPREAGTGHRREHFVDAACGLYLGSRLRGAPRLDAAHLVPTLYELHTRLLAGDTGHNLVGAGGLLLLGLGLSGVYLAWPRPLGARAWRRALTIQWRGAPARRWYDSHRASGLWLAPLLLLLSATGAAMVFKDSTRSLVAAVLPTEAAATRRAMSPAASGGAAQSAAQPAPAAAAPAPAASAAALGPDALVALAERQFSQARWTRLTLAKPGGAGLAEVRLLQPGEPRADTGATRLRLDAQGQVRHRSDPLQAPAGNRVLDWLFPLHSAEAFGLLPRLLWSAFGLLPTLLLATGGWLWWRRWRGRRAGGA